MKVLMTSEENWRTLTLIFWSACKKQKKL